MKTLKLALLAMLLCAAPAFASPVTITGVGQTWQHSYNGIVDYLGSPTVMPGLYGRVRFEVTGLVYNAGTNHTLLSLDLTIRNQADAAVWQYATIAGVAFNTNPNVIRAGSSASGALGYVALGQSLPGTSGFDVEVCVSGKRNTCDTRSPLGVGAGDTGVASVILSFNGNLVGQQLDFSNFAISWHDLISPQYGFTATTQGYGVPVTPPIPEPASAAVFGLGALIVGVALRRMRAS